MNEEPDKISLIIGCTLLFFFAILCYLLTSVFTQDILIPLTTLIIIMIGFGAASVMALTGIIEIKQFVSSYKIYNKQKTLEDWK